MNGFSFSDMCHMLGKDAVYVRNLQRVLTLHMPDRDEGYSQGYLAFLEKVVALRALHVPQDKVTELFETEKKCLQLLHVDSLSDSPTWYLDACAAESNGHPDDRLLLTGHRLGFAVQADAVQHTLDFGGSGRELFRGAEMGEDVRLVLAKYLRLVRGIQERVAREATVLEHALRWAKRELVDR
jgi:hypothetical protein